MHISDWSSDVCSSDLQRIEIDRDLRDTDAVPLGRDGRMQVGQRLGVIEPGAFGHEAFDELEQTIGAIDEAAQDLARLDAALRLAFLEPALGARDVPGGRPVPQREAVAIGRGSGRERVGWYV